VTPATGHKLKVQRALTAARGSETVKTRIAHEKSAFQKMKTILSNRNILFHTRLSILECYIEPILMYGCASWTIDRQSEHKKFSPTLAGRAQDDDDGQQLKVIRYLAQNTGFVVSSL
jgi:hypothetical protein